MTEPVPPWEQARHMAIRVRRELAEGKRARRPITLELCAEVEHLAGGMAAAYEQIRQLERLELELIEGLRERFDLELWHRAGRWCWRWGKEEGSAATLVGAVQAGMAAAGGKRPPAPPLDKQLRAAGAPELPGFAEEQRRRHEGGPI